MLGLRLRKSKARVAQRGIGPQAGFYIDEEEARAKLIEAKKAFNMVVSSQDTRRKPAEDARTDKALVMEAGAELSGMKKAYEALLEQKRLDKAKDRARKGYDRGGGLGLWAAWRAINVLNSGPMNSLEVGEALSKVSSHR